ncbi:hypothetical protein Pla8534_40480 [Lignipirellula cremea]|uniref:Uncharacterized protein n=1 Tax=Lignipirellula cremea TaxID=2528010 RepID=A0A518DWM1_9BACT|nr:hypothetical protein Pla8534_40480 [Lignipirellula cremea]
MARRSLSPVNEEVSTSIDAQRRKWLVWVTLKELPNLSVSVVISWIFFHSVRLVGFESIVKRPRNRSNNKMLRFVNPGDGLCRFVQPPHRKMTDSTQYARTDGGFAKCRPRNCGEPFHENATPVDPPAKFDAE